MIAISVSYDVFGDAFLMKISDYDFLELFPLDRDEIVDGYMRRAIANFKKQCLYDLSSTADNTLRQFNVDIKPEDLDEIADIISEGMIVQWLHKYVYKQEILQNVINTRDFSLYSPAELLYRIGEAYRTAQKNFIQAVREYSYNHGKLTELHS